MLTQLRSSLPFLLLLILDAGAFVPAQDRVTDNFDFDWLFHLGDCPDAMQPEFKPVDWDWQAIQLPHDWSVVQPFNQRSGGAAGYLPGGIGLYRKEFQVPESYRDKIVTLLFEGVYHDATVFLNGTQIGSNRYGYTGFAVDLSPHLNFGGNNTLFVRVDRRENSRWYTGSGIYRHVKLIVTDPVHVALWGTYVTTHSVSKESADIRITTSVVNSLPDTRKLRIVQRLLDSDKKPVLRENAAIAHATDLTLDGRATGEVVQAFHIDRPRLWSLESPARYFMETTIKDGDETRDTFITPFGIRYYDFTSDKGFFLNGEHVRLQGVNLHQSAAVLGTALPDRAMERRLEKLKEFGCNAIRFSHYPPSPYLLELCDRLGFFVIDEAFDKWKSGYYGKFFDESWQKDLGTMVCRDRNHPSVFVWSVGNEVAEAKDSETGPRRAKMLADFVRKLDPTRPVTMAIQPGASARHELGGEMDIIGYNYIEPLLLEDRARFPDRRFFISEAYPYYSAVRAESSRDYSPKNPWNYVLENEFILGSFIWAGVDYLGESSGWPAKGWTCSPFDSCMFERPAAAYHRAVWKKEPMVKLAVVDYALDIHAGKDHWQYPPMADHWNFPYGDRRVLEIRSMTNCEEVELIVDGRSFGKRRSTDYVNGTIVWFQPFSKGTVEAVGLIDGKEVCRDTLKSHGATMTLALIPDRETIKADGQDMLHLVVELRDKNGVRVQTDDRKLTVTVSGPGRFLGIDNGDLRRADSFVGNVLTTYFGRALIMVQSDRKPGTIGIEIETEGLQTQRHTIETK
ncbi:MAG TPA: beta-glycosidase [Planctomycetaceae bacterium]|nr:beta-glycosidase [Planctomycetaceae bacterium]